MAGRLIKIFFLFMCFKDIRQTTVVVSVGYNNI